MGVGIGLLWPLIRPKLQALEILDASGNYVPPIQTARVELDDDLTLTADSALVQVLNPDDDGHSVTLPDAGAAAMFVLVNIGDYAVTLLDGSATLIVLAAGEARLVFSDGENGWGVSGDLGFAGNTFEHGTVLPFGSSNVAAGQFLRPGQGSGVSSYPTLSSTLTFVEEQVVPFAGSITAIDATTYMTSATLKTYKNGALADTLTVTIADTRGYTGEGDTSFAAGDRMAIEADAVSGTGAFSANVLYKATSKADAVARVPMLANGEVTTNGFGGHNSQYAGSLSANSDRIAGEDRSGLRSGRR